MYLSPNVRHALAGLLAAVSPWTPLGAQQADTAAARPAPAADLRSIAIQRAPGAIQVDARLEDAGWVGAARASGFVEMTPREGAQPPVETEVLLTYDDKNFYVAWIAKDPNPDAIRATLQPRDRLWSDDWVGVLIEPFGGSSLGYYFIANPIGVQGDLQMNPQGEDGSIDFIYTTAGRITEDGYVIEMAIPFSSLRFPNRPVQEWGIMLVRTYPRSSRHYITWPSLSRNNPCQLCQLAKLQGIEGVRPGGTLDVLPAVVASQSGRLQDPSNPASFENGRVTPDASLGLKYAFQGGWTAEATLNPDFSQVESDAAQVDVNTTFALFFPERRPFFQEGMDLYETPMNVFYSRSINDPQVATKLTGRRGRTSFGWVGARDEHTPFFLPFEERSAVLEGGRSFTNVLRARQNVYGNSYVGGLLTDRRLDGGGSGTTASVDGLFRFREVYSLSAHLVGSYTREPDDPGLSARLPKLTFGSGDDRHTAAFDGESYAGRASFVRVARDARTWSWNALYMDLSPTYRADAGFQSRNDFRRASVWTGMTFFPRRYGVERISSGLLGGTIWNFRGEGKETWINPSVSLTLPRQTNVGINARFADETFRGVELTGIRRYGMFLVSNFSDPLRVGFEVGRGESVARMLAVPEVGAGMNARAWATIKPISRVVIEPSLTYEELNRLGGEEIFSGYIARTRFNFQYNRELQFRMVAQYNDFSERLDLEPLLAYQLNPFSIFYVGSTYGSRQFDGHGLVGTQRQYFAKIQYLFRP
ncbi:MAG TPA: DUF5916 domain-containing protein [Longimicrobiaceae bacterium]|nr:DUF5916 domain-containing protein [Longimicrobiaceae bacterium]